MKYQLAIVIPAYKSDYFEQTLASVANQTCKDFTLYIGDDASPADISSMVNKYKERILIVYNRFDKNIGGNDLVAHWNRCVDLTAGEEWIWLFSDDDIMSADCVELFYNYISRHPGEDLLHFNVEVINGFNEKILEPKPFPEYLSAPDFFSSRVQVQLNSYVVEYIFRREVYLSMGKFENFDLAWSADDATWLKFSKNKGIRTISGGLVKWRYSQKNISSILGDKAIITRKLNASVAYLNWVKDFFKQNRLTDPTTSFAKFRCLFITLIKNASLSTGEKFRFTLFYLDKLGYRNLKILSVSYLAYTLLKKRLFNLKYIL